MVIDFNKRSTIDLAIDILTDTYRGIKRTKDRLDYINSNQAVRDAIDHLTSAMEIIAAEHENIMIEDVKRSKKL